jgi:hypothetical protein
MRKFHVKDGLFFEALPDGSVCIRKHQSPGREIDPVVFEQTLDAAAWASVIATMSYYDETDNGFYRAMNFHAGEPIPPSCPLNKQKLRG